MHQQTRLVPEPPLLGWRGPDVRSCSDDGPTDTEFALLALADPCRDSRVSLIGPHTIELLCVLLRRGYTEVSAVRVSDWPPSGTADVAIIPDPSAPGLLERAIAHARRVLSPLGTLALHLPTGPTDIPAQHARRLLLLQGFSAIRVRDYAGETLIRAELPMLARLACA